MIYETFTWPTETEGEGTSAFRVQTAQFGDGYAQEVGDGLNNETQSWPLTFSGYESYVREIRDFLRAHGGFRPFRWKPPMGDAGLYVCREFTIRPVGGQLYTLSATFTQRFAP